MNNANLWKLTQTPIGKTQTFSRCALASMLTIFMVTASASDWDYMGGNKGKGYTVCDKVKKHLNEFSYPKDFSSCTWHAIASTPGLKEPPWQELDPKKHQDLLLKLFQYGQSSATNYFTGISPKNVADPMARVKDRLREFTARGGRMQVWRTSLPLETVPHIHGEINLVRLVQRFTDMDNVRAQCKGMKFADWIGEIYGVTDDLSGPDPRVGNGEKDIFQSSDVLMYAGRPYFISPQFSVEIHADINELLNNFCTIQYTK